MIKKLVAVLLILSITIPFVFIAVVAEDTPRFTVSDVEAEPGDYVDVTLACEGNPGITAWKIDIDYDRDAMELTDCSSKYAFEGVMTSDSFESFPYTISWSNDLEDLTTNGTIAVLRFHIKENAEPGEYSIGVSYDPDNVYSIVLDDSGLEKNVHFDTKDGVIKVNGSEIDSPSAGSTFALSDVTAAPGDNVEVTLSCSDNPGITAWKLDVAYDKDVMELTECSADGVFTGVMTSSSVEAYPYTLSWSNDLEDETVNGTVAVLKFHINKNAVPGEYKIELSYDPDNVYSVELDESGFETNVHFNTTDGVVTVAEKQEDTPTLDKPTFALSDVTATPGDDVEVTLSCSDNPGITAWKLDVAYDKEIMELTECSTDGVFNGVMTSSTVEAYPYTLSWSNDLEDETVNGTVAVMKFHIKENVAAGEYRIELSYDPENVYSVVLDDSGMETNVAFAVKASTVTIGESEEKGIYGDVDLDLMITSADALIILRTSIGLEVFTAQQNIIGDVDLDKHITANDALTVLRFSIGYEDANSIVNTPIA